MNKVLDIFYNQIIKEATTGTINCFLYFNMPFNTYIYETNEKYECNFEGQEELLIPTLIIKNKQQFDQYLVEYTNLALKFYYDNNFPEEILNDKLFYEGKICKEKMILTTLWSNATVDDFKDPLLFLKKRISFLKNDILNLNLGYSNILEGNLQLNIQKDSILNETPLQLELLLINSNNETYHFPKIKFGIHDNTVFIYAVQNKENESNPYTKKIKRKLYKINDGFFDDYEIENLKDITPSFLVALNIAVGYFRKIGINKVLVPNILIERWNAKTMAIQKRAKIKNLSLEELSSLVEKQNEIWVNINEKLNRTFRRLAYHTNGIKIVSEPFLIDSHLHLELTNNYEYNNNFLNETASIIDKSQKNL